MPKPFHNLLHILALIGVLALVACGTPVPTADQPAASVALESIAPTSSPAPPTTSAITAATAAPPDPITTSDPVDRSQFGGEIAYIKLGNIWRRDLATGAETALTIDGAWSDPAWSPDGQTLAATRSDNNGSAIVLFGADGTERDVISDTQYPRLLPAFSSGGTLYYVRRWQNPDAPLIEVTMRSSGPEITLQVEPGGLCAPTVLSVGSDQRRALSLDCGRGSTTLLSEVNSEETIDASSLLEKEDCATGGVYAHTAPRLALITAHECAFENETTLVVLDQTTTPPTATTILRSQQIIGVAWSPDDRWLVFARSDGALAGLWIVDSAGGEPQRLTTEGAQPAWRAAR